MVKLMPKEIYYDPALFLSLKVILLSWHLGSLNTLVTSA
jgi:hypothetical protein